MNPVSTHSPPKAHGNWDVYLWAMPWSLFGRGVLSLEELNAEHFGCLAPGLDKLPWYHRKTSGQQAEREPLSGETVSSGSGWWAREMWGMLAQGQKANRDTSSGLFPNAQLIFLVWHQTLKTSQRDRIHRPQRWPGWAREEEWGSKMSPRLVWLGGWGSAIGWEKGCCSPGLPKLYACRYNPALQSTFVLASFVSFYKFSLFILQPRSIGKNNKANTRSPMGGEWAKNTGFPRATQVSFEACKISKSKTQYPRITQYPKQNKMKHTHTHIQLNKSTNRGFSFSGLLSQWWCWSPLKGYYLFRGQSGAVLWHSHQE